MLDGSGLLKHILARFLLAASRLGVTRGLPARRVVGGLSRLDPYWVVYTTTAKGRWLGRNLLDVLSTEFRERSAAYYVRVDDSFVISFRSWSRKEMCDGGRRDYFEREACEAGDRR
jgi:hypothetical protein